MLKSLTIKNFKSLENVKVDFGNLTLLAGINNSGKSSIFQALMLLRQSYLTRQLDGGKLALNGSLFSIGSASDALFRDASEDIIAFEIECSNEESALWEFNYSEPNADFLDLKAAPDSDRTKYYKIYSSTSLFDNRKFNYLSADRSPPRLTYPMSNQQVLHNQSLGKHGEYTAHFLSVYEAQKIPNKLLAHPKAVSSELKYQVEAWMGEICPGIKIQSLLSPDIQQAKLQFLEGASDPYSPINVGFGLTYTLPVIVSILFAEPGRLLLIENPEAHLHPKGQSKIGELIAAAAGCGVQVLVETHSDHVLNGMRKAVLREKILPSEFQVKYLKKEKKNLASVTTISTLPVDKSGKLGNWPEGFFDQIEIDSLELI